ncbi:hypothetical protein H0H81_010376 [Sphagnurus paluster]|uniref:Uncharacterized protein n=1 Tax=Sphagnurus paluster TaxID=117069 RepID=A0A9P7FUU9_9AGAR|nr:hypothetical protein H0H81_010376 [Sphagnurus paluster]
MPSFRTIFFVAATAFAALTSAAPTTGVPNGNDIVGSLGLTDGKVQSRAMIDNLSLGGLTKSRRHNGEDHSPKDGKHNDKNTHNGLDTLNMRLPERSDGERSLCDTIVLASANIRVIWDKMSKVTSQNKIDDNAVVELIANVKVVLDSTVVDIKKQNGRPMEEILALNGRVATKAELSHLLIDLANLVCGLLSIAAYVSAKATVDVIVSVGVVFAEVFCATFTVVDGLYVIVRPGLDSALKIAVGLKLDALVKVYNGVY